MARVKKVSPAWQVALTYYVLANLIANLLYLLFFWLLPKPELSDTLTIVVAGIISILLYVVGLYVSGKNTMQVYLIPDANKIRNIATGLFVILNTIMMIGWHRISHTPVVLGNILGMALLAGLVYFLTPRFIKTTDRSQIDAALAAQAATPETGKDIAKGLGKAVLLGVGIVVTLIIVVVLGIKFF